MKKSLEELLEDLLGEITWTQSSWGDYKGQRVGHITCPKVSEHTTPTRDDHTAILFPEDGWPFVKCVHSSCKSAIQELNEDIRNAIEDSVLSGELYFKLPTISKAVKEELRYKRILKERINKERGEIIKNHWNVGQIIEDSPIQLSPEDDHGLALLHLFDKQDIVWMGEPYDSGRPSCQKHFREAGYWMDWAKDWPRYIAPCTFKEGVYQRTKSNMRQQKFLVVESDVLSKPQQGAIFKWLIGAGHTLRAVVDTGNKSLHGWFDYPEESAQRWIYALIELGCDGATMRGTQPVRFPGAWRKQGVMQRLLYLDL